MRRQHQLLTSLARRSICNSASAPLGASLSPPPQSPTPPLHPCISTPNPTSTTAAAASAVIEKKLISTVDSSVNYILRFGRGTIESRYIRRSPDSISVYVSSHTGCKMACKFCWLTAQGQTDFQHVNLQHFTQQVRTVLQDAPNPSPLTPFAAATLPPTTALTRPRSQVRVNINFMSRGEALANKHVIHSYDHLYHSLDSTVREELGFASMKMNLSTIMPYTIRNRRLSDVFKFKPVSLFYSLYSLSPTFRSKWLPNAIDPLTALDQLKQLQVDYENHYRQLGSEAGDTTTDTSVSAKKTIVVPHIHFHWAFIEGENDDESELTHLLSEIRSRQFTHSKFNLVRFNPHPSITYREPDPKRLESIFSLIQSSMSDSALDPAMHKSRIIPRVGPDVFASCGMFQRDDDGQPVAI